jgi:hypothetical protein
MKTRVIENNYTFVFAHAINFVIEGRSLDLNKFLVLPPFDLIKTTQFVRKSSGTYLTKMLPRHQRSILDTGNG